MARWLYGRCAAIASAVFVSTMGSGCFYTQGTGDPGVTNATYREQVGGERTNSARGNETGGRRSGY